VLIIGTEPGAKALSASKIHTHKEEQMKVKPLADRVLVKPLEAEEKTAGGIIIPENAKEKPQQGEVVAVGDGKIADSGQKIEMSLKKGDKVLYGKYSGTEVSVEGEDYLIMRESDVLAVI
jgi:chaperonin GroES